MLNRVSVLKETAFGGHTDLDLSLWYEVGSSWHMPRRDPSAILYHPWSQCPVLVQCLVHSRGSFDICWDRGEEFLEGSIARACTMSQASFLQWFMWCPSGLLGWALLNAPSVDEMVWGVKAGRAKTRPSLGKKATTPHLLWCYTGLSTLH